MTFKLPVWKKTHFTGDDPDDLDDQFFFIIQAVPTAYCDASADTNRNWVCSIYGTTTARDS